MGCDWWASDFKRTFPTCPICGSDLGYDVATKFATPHFKCRSCMTVWKLIVEGLGWKTQRRYLLVEPDKDLRASSLVKKGDRWHEGYKEEFWKSLRILGFKKRIELAEAKKSMARPLAYLGIVLGILGIIILAVNIWYFGFYFEKYNTLAAACSSFPAIIIGGIALKLASEKERTLCYIPILLGIIGLFGTVTGYIGLYS
jgi:hypothetical protein